MSSESKVIKAYLIKAQGTKTLSDRHKKRIVSMKDFFNAKTKYVGPQGAPF